MRPGSLAAGRGGGGGFGGASQASPAVVDHSGSGTVVVELQNKQKSVNSEGKTVGEARSVHAQTIGAYHGNELRCVLLLYDGQ